MRQFGEEDCFVEQADKGDCFMKHKDNSGFSMVELIIVIAIMAILAGALAPTLIKYVNKSRITSDLDSADTLAKATQLALVDQEVANYIFTKTMPYSVDADSLDSSDVFEAFVLEKLGTAPKIKYTKNGAQKFQITIVESGQGGYTCEITAKGASITSTTGVAASHNGDGAMLYPDPDDVYK